MATQLRLGLLCALLAGACVSPPLDGRRCATDEDCVGGWRCVDEVCERFAADPPGDDAGPPRRDAGPDAGGLPPVDAGADAGTPVVDAGPFIVDGGSEDAGVPPFVDGGVDAGPAVLPVLDGGGPDAGRRCEPGCTEPQYCRLDVDPPVCVECIFDFECSDSPVGNRCTTAGVCGCETTGPPDCDDIGGLSGLCLVDPEQGFGACVAQTPIRCGIGDGVVSAEGDEVPGGVCSPLLGGVLCVEPAGEASARCGCADDDHCRPVQLVDGWPRRSADHCAGDACGCASAVSEACSVSRPDCTNIGCVNLAADRASCGVVGNNCQDPGTGLDDGTGVCLGGGCECDGSWDCTMATNVDACATDTFGTHCVCDGFTVAGVSKYPCPMGLTCTADGCQYLGNSYATYNDLLAALAQ